MRCSLYFVRIHQCQNFLSCLLPTWRYAKHCNFHKHLKIHFLRAVKQCPATNSFAGRCVSNSLCAVARCFPTNNMFSLSLSENWTFWPFLLQKLKNKHTALLFSRYYTKRQINNLLRNKLLTNIKEMEEIKDLISSLSENAFEKQNRDPIFVCFWTMYLRIFCWCYWIRQTFRYEIVSVEQS